MSHFTEIKALVLLADIHATFAQNLYKNYPPNSEQKLHNCAATVLRYSMRDGDTIYLLKSYDTIVAMVDEKGDGIDFLRYVCGYTATSARHIRKFFVDYCKDNAFLYVYKP